MSGVDVLAVMDSAGMVLDDRAWPAMEEAKTAVAELIDAARWALKVDDAGAMSDTARHNLEQALAAIGGAQ